MMMDDGHECGTIGCAEQERNICEPAPVGKFRFRSDRRLRTTTTQYLHARKQGIGAAARGCYMSQSTSCFSPATTNAP